MKSGQSIRHLKLKGDHSEEYNNLKFMVHLLKQTVEYCPNLESLCLSKPNMQYMEHDLYLFEPVGISLRYLELKR
jgi:hypothetical protein